MIAMFVEVALACLSLQNFQSAMQIYSGLNLTPVQRLTNEWKSLGKKHKEGWAELMNFFDQTGNVLPPPSSFYSLLSRFFSLLSLQILRSSFFVPYHSSTNTERS